MGGAAHRPTVLRQLVLKAKTRYEVSLAMLEKAAKTNVCDKAIRRALLSKGIKFRRLRTKPALTRLPGPCWPDRRGAFLRILAGASGSSLIKILLKKMIFGSRPSMGFWTASRPLLSGPPGPSFTNLGRCFRNVIPLVKPY